MKTWIIVAVVLMAIVLAGCGDMAPTTENADRVSVANQQLLYQQNQPIPVFDWSQDRDSFIQIYKLRNDSRNTWTVITGMTGQVVDIFPSKGYPLPADTQLTNPQTMASFPAAGGGWMNTVVEQAEPNGLFSSKNTVGTWCLKVRDNGDIVPIYTELNATAYPYAIEIVNGQIKEVKDSPSSSTIQLKKGN